MSSALLESPSRPVPSEGQKPLPLEPALCCLCGVEDVDPIGVGEDFEYRTCPDSFLVVRCRRCRMVFLNPRPSELAHSQIYPNDYHAFQFQETEYGLVHKIRRRLEAKRLLKWCRKLPADARILDVGCGDGFHLSLLKEFGPPSWQLVGLDADERAAEAGRKKGLNIQTGYLQELRDEKGFDLIFLIMTIEHVSDPRNLLESVYTHLKPAGRVVIVTDNTKTLDHFIFMGRHWGGYHFPRHTYLFNRDNLSELGKAVGLQPVKVRSAVSPVNWVYSIRNVLDDWGFSKWLVRRFSLKSVGSLTIFTLWDMLLNLMGYGSILHAEFQKPLSTEKTP